MKVLDASALLAFLFREPGADRVAEALPRSCMSAVNLSEVAARIVRDNVDPAEVRQRLERLPVEVVAFDREAGFRTAELQPVTASLGLSLGERACLALAQQRRLTALTAERSWVAVAGVDVELIR